MGLGLLPWWTTIGFVTHGPGFDMRCMASGFEPAKAMDGENVHLRIWTTIGSRRPIKIWGIFCIYSYFFSYWRLGARERCSIWVSKLTWNIFNSGFHLYSGSISDLCPQSSNDPRHTDWTSMSALREFRSQIAH